jgi:hypothetical protein
MFQLLQNKLSGKYIKGCEIFGFDSGIADDSSLLGSDCASYCE